MLPVLYDVQTSRQRIDSILIGWRYAMTAVVAGTRVTIKRSYAPNDGFVELATVQLADGFYVDDTHAAADKRQQSYYTLTVFSAEGTKTYGPYFVRDHLDRVGAFIVRRMQLMLRNIDARPVLIYQPAYGAEAQRCPQCWDAVAQQAVYSNCQTCKGTTFVGTVDGYYAPVLTLMDIQPPVKARRTADIASEPSWTAGRMANYPLLHAGDVIRELNTGVMWKVLEVMPQRKDAAVLTQDPVKLRELPRGDVEYEITVPNSVRPVLTRRHPRYERIMRDDRGGVPEFLEVFV